MTYWSCPGDTKASYEEAITQLARVSANLDDGEEGRVGEGELQMGYKFGPSWTNHWIKAVITIPEELRNVDQQVICTSQLTSCAIRLGKGVADDLVEFDPSCEALIFSSDGVPQHGMSPPPHPSMFDTQVI